jgi:hypothetical protein
MTKHLNCRVMLGGEIYYRAIGRPWGPAADFIVIVNSLTAVAATGRRPGPPASGRSHRGTRAFKFESGRQKVLRSTIRRPPVRLSDSDRLTQTVCDCRSAWFLHKNKFASRCCHRAGKRIKMNNRKPKKVLPTPVEHRTHHDTHTI